MIRQTIRRIDDDMFIWLDKTEFYDTRCLGTDPCEGALGNKHLYLSSKLHIVGPPLHRVRVAGSITGS